ncbi:hypothetical protein VZT92_006044 [Zoarces viviparus]|uniref:Uncharacterized protein n=1 Tax=Zoarces viviparus TaxID=48416 RepID=A0AAW1FN24_ZOAVI
MHLEVFSRPAANTGSVIVGLSICRRDRLGERLMRMRLAVSGGVFWCSLDVTATPCGSCVCSSGSAVTCREPPNATPSLSSS